MSAAMQLDLGADAETGILKELLEASAEEAPPLLAVQGRVRGVRKGMKYCRAHQTTHPESEFIATSGQVCLPAKKVLDSVYKQSKSQGELEWYHELRASETCQEHVLPIFSVPSNFCIVF